MVTSAISFCSRSSFLSKGLQRVGNREKPQGTGKSSVQNSLLISWQLPINWTLLSPSQPGSVSSFRVADGVLCRTSYGDYGETWGYQEVEAIKIIHLVNLPTIGKIHVLLQLVLQTVVVRKWKTSAKSVELNGFVIVISLLKLRLLGWPK